MAATTNAVRSTTKKILGRYTQVPVTLFRHRMAKPPLVIRLRPKRDMPIYDLTLHDGAMVIPAPVTGEFIGTCARVGP